MFDFHLRATHNLRELTTEQIMSPLKAIRLERRQTLEEVAGAIGVAHSTLSRIERNGCNNPELAEKLAKHFRYAVSEMQILYPERFPTCDD